MYLLVFTMVYVLASANDFCKTFVLVINLLSFKLITSTYVLKASVAHDKNQVIFYIYLLITYLVSQRP